VLRLQLSESLAQVRMAVMASMMFFMVCLSASMLPVRLFMFLAMALLMASRYSCLKGESIP